MSTDSPVVDTPETWPIFSGLERRILGVLIEKQKTTPDAYPMSINAIVTGSNQKSNRDPVMNVDDADAENTLNALREKGLVIKITGGRVERWRHQLYDRWSVNKVEIALLAELLLRGAQTEGELRGRASRMEPLDDLEQLRQALRPLVERKLAIMLGPEGKRGTMIAHGFYAPQEIEVLRSQGRAEEAAAGPTHALAAPAASVHAELHVRISQLEMRLKQADEAIHDLQRQMQALKESLGS
jgi:uncharacterized protein